MHEKFQLISMQKAKVQNQDRYHIEKETLAGQMGKIMGKLKHDYNPFPKLQTMFFHNNNAPFGHFHQVSMNFITISTFSKFQVQLTMRKKVTTRYLSLSFSKYNETSPMLVYYKETSGTVMHAKFQLISMQRL